LRRRLEELLSEDPRQAAQRAAAYRSLRGRNVLLYGAGRLGQSVLEKLRAHDVAVVAFVDDTPAKVGTSIANTRVLSLAEASALRDESVLVVSMLNPQSRFDTTRRRLEALGWGTVVSMPELCWAYPEKLLPWLQCELPQTVLAKADSIRRCFALLADHESRRQLVAHLRFRLWCDHAALPEAAADQYFPPDVVPDLPADVVFVDCGAYDGDTLRDFLHRHGERFDGVHAFEPDAASFRRLTHYRDQLGEGLRERLFLHRLALGERHERSRFASTGDAAAALSPTGAEEVEVVPLTEVVAPHQPMYIKFDIEGAEAAALRGAAPLIRATHPWLAVSVYHRPDDLWDIPVYLRSLVGEYRLLLRTHGEDGMDIICYAVTDGFERTPEAL
jgi:FkbM family methyltransferase